MKLLVLSLLPAFCSANTNPEWFAQGYEEFGGHLISTHNGQSCPTGSITIPFEVSSSDVGLIFVIDSDAFAGCSNLTEVTFSEGLTNINSGAFTGSGLTEVTFPSQGLQYVEDGAFDSNVCFTNPTVVSGMDFMGQACGGEGTDDSAYTCTCSNGSPATGSACTSDGAKCASCDTGYGLSGGACAAITVPEWFTPGYERRSDGYLIRRHNGESCPTGSITIPSEVLSGKIYYIDYDAFKDCSELTDVTFSEGLIVIRFGAFEGTGLTKVTFPSTLDYSEKAAFDSSVCFTNPETGAFGPERECICSDTSREVLVDNECKILLDGANETELMAAYRSVKSCDPDVTSNVV